MDARNLVGGALVPALVAGITLFALVRWRVDRGAPFIAALAFCAGYLVAHVVLVGAPRMPWGESQPSGLDWIVWFAVLAVVLSGLREVPAWKSYSGLFATATLAVLMPRTWLAPDLEATHPGFGGLALRFVISLGLYALVRGAERLAEKRPGPALPAAFAVASAGVALACLFSRSGSLAQLAGAVCALFLGAVVAAIARRELRLPTGAIAVAFAVLTGCAFNAVRYELPVLSAWLLAAAFAAPWVAELRAFTEWTGARALAARVFPAALLAAVAVWCARIASPGFYSG